MNLPLYWVEGTPRLAFEMHGSGPPLVFLHGIGGNRHMWRAQIDAFKSDFTVISWDARGYGDSDDYAGPLDFSDFGNDLVRLLDQVGAERAHLVGLSMGARILMDFFPRYSDRAASLTLCDCFYGFESALTPEKQAEFIALRQRPLLDGTSLEDLAPTLIDSLAGADCTDEVRDMLRRSILALHKESYLKTIAATVKYDRSADLPSFSVPVQLIFGELDALTPPSIGEAMQRLMPDANLAVLPRAGHLSNLEQPEAFNAILRAFLGPRAESAFFHKKGKKGSRMLYAVMMLDKPGSDALRAATKDAHKAFVQKNASRMFLGGPLLAEDGKTMIGSLIIIDSADRAEAEALVEMEPYRRAGLFESVVIRSFSPVIAPGKNLPAAKDGALSP